MVKGMSYLIFGDSFTFPEGDAATNRVSNYAKGLSENGIKVHIICFSSEYNNSGDSTLNGFFYYHPFRQIRRNKFFMIRRWYKIARYFNTISLIRRIALNEKIVAIHCYTQLLRTQFFAFCLAKAYRSRLVLERSEHPMRYFNNNVLQRLYGNLRIFMEARFCDTIFCISDYLIKFYRSKGVDNSRLFKVPSTVDPERFASQLDRPYHFKYVLYCGSLTLLKDGVDLLIKSFAKISRIYREINLVLVGEADNNEDDRFLRGLISDLQINDRVIFTGKLPRNDVAAFMVNAEALLLARPNSMIADAGFPSKLTEYLATGIPVVVTKVGEIQLYLKDNENAFLSEPETDQFGARLCYVLNNIEFARQVGNKGKDLTYNVFNYKYQATRILEYLNSSC